jgi:exodeoxyribonuclease VII large subunit
MIDGLQVASLRPVWTVGALVRDVTELLAGRFAVCTVRGELSGYSRAASGHCYFNLKDADGEAALLRCAMFRRAAGMLDFAPADGQLVEVRGRLGVYEPRGELQFIVEAMRRAGAGALFEQFLQTRARLAALGLFDAARKRAMPVFPRTVGIVTSLGAAALADVLTALARRAPHVAVVVYPSLVQGADAPAALCAALAQAARHAQADVLIVCRGGGSLEDLWAFNDERVVRAMAASPVPVVSGVGHETDVTLADLVADLRAPTPTAAAELAVPATQTWVDGLQARADAMQRRVHTAVDREAQHLDRVAQRMARPSQAVRAQRQRVDALAHRLTGHPVRLLNSQGLRLQQADSHLRQAGRHALTLQTHKLAMLAARLRSADPRHVLARGYAWLGNEAGQAVTSVRQLALGDSLQVVLNDGAAGVRVTQVPEAES